MRDVTPLHYAVQSGNSETVTLLIEKGTSVNALTIDNQTVLHLAAQCGNSESAKLLIEKGAPVNAPEISDPTTLNSAAQSGNPEIDVLGTNQERSIC
jgi:ankyrin repeat protein